MQSQMLFQLQAVAYILISLTFPICIVYTLQIINPLTLLIAPVTYGLLYLAIICGLGFLHRKKIIAGKFKRSVSCQQYMDRRLYGLCWTLLYYCTPLYHVVLSLPLLKTLVLKAFGYKGAINVTLYPDTWIRDLPLLDIGEGVYIANKATLGTNMPLLNGKILVNKITIGANSLIGHSTKVGPGAVVGSNTEITTDCAIGLCCKIGNNVRIAGRVTVNHYATIGNGTSIGCGSYIGLNSKIGENLTIPAGVVIPDRTQVLTQADVLRYIVSLPSAVIDMEQLLRA